VLELTYRDTFGSDFCLMMVVPSLFEEVIGCSGTELPYRIIAQLYCSYLSLYVIAYIYSHSESAWNQVKFITISSSSWSCLCFLCWWLGMEGCLGTQGSLLLLIF
jgi:hypothetical protein